MINRLKQERAMQLKHRFGKKAVERLKSKMTKQELAESLVLCLKIMYTNSLLTDRVANEVNRSSNK